MTKYIKRHDKFARANHWAFSVGGVVLGLTGLLLFIPGLGRLVGYDTLKTATIIHRIFAVCFIMIPAISWIIRPANLKHTFHNLFMKWDDDDKEFMKLFFPYMLNPKKYHMPKQQFVKSGQRFSDILMYLCIFGIALSGILLWAGSNIVSPELYQIWLAGHDLCFLGIGIMFPIHIFLGGGIFQPYHRVSRVMFGDGLVTESDALYHWGHWADEEIASGENIVEK
ncbi:MAG: cytochrome b/b6 domain-containing protein [Coriobacteriia bacterium]|nr:cytochrome b/b6 domain-containing protein [Coriobacteriia bacterium]